MDSKGFFSGLFDFSFTSLITPRIVQIIYVLGLVVAGLSALAFLFTGFASGGAAAALALILSPIIFLVSAVFFRVYLEVVMVLFKIADNTSIMARDQDRRLQ
jgi:hypothetical protein